MVCYIEKKSDLRFGIMFTVCLGFVTFKTSTKIVLRQKKKKKINAFKRKKKQKKRYSIAQYLFIAQLQV